MVDAGDTVGVLYPVIIYLKSQRILHPYAKKWKYSVELKVHCLEVGDNEKHTKPTADLKIYDEKQTQQNIQQMF